MPSTTLIRSVPEDFPLPAPSPSDQLDRSTWPALESYLTSAFRLKSRDEWTRIFLGTESCCVPVLAKEEVDSSGRGADEPGVAIDEDERESGGVPHPAPRLVRTPASTRKESREGPFLEPGRDTRRLLEQAGLGDKVAELSQAGAISLGEEPPKSKL